MLFRHWKAASKRLLRLEAPGHDKRIEIVVPEVYRIRRWHGMREGEDRKRRSGAGWRFATSA